MIRRITIHDLLTIPQPLPLADVRTPAEFAQGHIPGAFNLPLFNNEERVQVGTTYKQQSREAAILLGFDLAGPKWSGFIRTALETASAKNIAVHCWRGGMRSGAMAWALDLYGFQVYLIDGGYRHYRRWVLDQFEKPWLLSVVGGMTGSGKTKILHELRQQGEQMIDLEDLAQHQGSAYGTLNRLLQPSQEQFENNLANQLHQLDPNQRIWIEDESLSIGKRAIPRSLWQEMQRSPLFDIQTPIEIRIRSLVEEYGSLDQDFLAESTERIRKRLGHEQTQRAITAIRENRMADFIREVLVYYDKTYRRALSGHAATLIVPVPVSNGDATKNSALLLEAAKSSPAQHSLWT